MTGSSAANTMDTTPTITTVDIYPYHTKPNHILKQSSYTATKIIHFIRHAEGTHNVDKNYRCITNLDARLTERGKEQSYALANRIRARAAATSSAAASDHNSSDNDDCDDKSRCPLADLYHNADLVVTSPLTRCVQTALLSLEPILTGARRKNPPPRVVAHEAIRETVNFNCDRRRMVHEIVQDFAMPECTQQEDEDAAKEDASSFPTIDFTSQITTPHDDLWEYYETWLGTHEEYTEHRESAQIYKVANRARCFFAWLATREEQHVVVCTHQAFLRALWNFGQTRYGRVGTDLPQVLDDRRPAASAAGVNQNDVGGVVKDVPVVRFCGNVGTNSKDSSNINDKSNGELLVDADVDSFAESLMKDYDNCEIRSVRVAWPA
jgi:broad specificity phosphatase PhoE